MKSYKLKPFHQKGTINYHKDLNPQQLKVVQEAEGPSLVLAGAGSGKTRVLIYRLAYLLEKGVSPKNILLATFTNKAANEMISRSEILLKSSLSNLWAGTFHHIGNVILRKEAKQIGYSPNFTIADKEDAKDLLDDCIEELGLYKKEKMFPKKDIIYRIYGLSCNSQKGIDEIIAQFYSHIQDYSPIIKKILSHYKKKKQSANVMDFSDLLTKWLELLLNPEICQKYSQTFKYILVDEYQDTNKLQFEILKRLSSYHKNILVVGDDAQSIYSFRAADINNILDFPKVFEGTKIFKLQTNYRSTPPVLNFANNIIKHNINQFPKELKAIKEGGRLPVLVKTADVYQQAKFIGQHVLELVNEGSSLNNLAVLFRSRFQSFELEMELLKRNIPYVIRGGLRFFEQAHIKDILSYLKIVINPADELSFKRAICLQKGIGRSYAHKIWNAFKKEKIIKNIADALPKRQRQGCKDFFALYDSLKQAKRPHTALTAILKNYKDYCHLSFDNPDERILELEELTKMSQSYPTLRQFLLDFSSFEEFKGETLLSATQKEDMLVLSTIHQAKGLEWENVFIIGCSDYDFPHPKSLASKEALEEERRLFYVATTRSKSGLYVTYPQLKHTFSARGGSAFGGNSGIIITRPSMFIYELPKDIYEEIMVEEGF